MRPQPGREEGDGSLLVYVRAEGCGTPALLMTPDATWSVGVFCRVAASTLRVADRATPRTASVRRTGRRLPADQPLGDAALRDYDLLDLVPADG